MLYMWQEERGKPYYRFQTDNKELFNKMKRRQNFKLVGNGLNCDLWIFQTTIARPDNARRMFEHISERKINYSSSEEIFSTI